MASQHGYVDSDVTASALCLRNGGILIYPTETFFALGCMADQAAAVDMLYQIKGRPVHKPLPLLAADTTQVDRVALLTAMPIGLEQFWPGPLTVLLPARPGLPASLVNPDGQVAVRVPPHTLAAPLALEAGGARPAPRANLSGGKPAQRAKDLDPRLLAALGGLALHGRAGRLLRGGPSPEGTLPSTVVAPLGPDQGRALRLIRPGRISMAALAAAGFTVLTDD